MADFICSVYYDSFAKTVSSINGKIAMFSKKEFIKEFDNKITYGFLFALEIHSIVLQKTNETAEDEKTAAQANVKFEKNISALVRDIVQFKMHAKATMI